jgi:2'-5' RNA ligase
VPDLRWSRPEQWHLTLKFFGAVPDTDALAASVADAVRSREPFTLSLGGGGAFPNPRRASVVWLGVQRGSDALSALAEPFAADDAAFGDRPFRAHLTLARTNRSRDVRAAVTALDACGESEPWTVDDVVLFESTGAVHTEIAQFELAG